MLILDTRSDIDLKELFAYKVLQGLGVGADISFVPNHTASKWMVYIASKEIADFKTLGKLELLETEDKLQNYSSIIIQMLSLYSIMMMSDHHLGNMGIDECGKSYIIDFCLIGQTSFNIKKDFYQKVVGSKKIKWVLVFPTFPIITTLSFSKILGTFEENIVIAKKFLQKLKFIDKVEEIFGTFMDENATILNNLVFENERKTDDLATYKQKIKDNAKSLEDFIGWTYRSFSRTISSLSMKYSKNLNSCAISLLQLQSEIWS